MQVRIAWGIWWLGLTLAWAAAAAPWQGMAAASEPAFWWQLRQHALYLSGIWSIGMMSLVMLLSLRQRWMERPLGGMDQVYRLHKWAGIAAAVAAVLHWGAKESSGLIKGMVGTAGRVPREAVLSWATDWRGTAKDLGEWAFYALLIMVVLTLWQRLLPYRPWRKLHRVMPALYLLLAFHTLALTPLTFWQAPLGMVMAALLLVGSVAALWSLAGRIGRGRNRYAAQVHEARVLGGAAGQAPLEVLCAMPKNWPGHRAGQFVFASFEGAEGPHPFTIASAPEGCGRTADGKELLRLVIKPLGDYTRRLPSLLQPGQAGQIEGPYVLMRRVAQHAPRSGWLVAWALPRFWRCCRHASPVWQAGMACSLRICTTARAMPRRMSCYPSYRLCAKRHSPACACRCMMRRRASI